MSKPATPVQLAAFVYFDNKHLKDVVFEFEDEKSRYSTNLGSFEVRTVISINIVFNVSRQHLDSIGKVKIIMSLLGIHCLSSY